MLKLSKKIQFKDLKFAPYIIGGFASVIVAIALILVFALIIRYVGISNNWIKPINISIKIISICVGVFIATKDGQHGLKKGVIVGIIFILLASIIFSILTKSFMFDLSLLADLGLGVVCGAISGVISVNLRK